MTIGRDGRPRKTQEELDAEMEDYWGGAVEKEEDIVAGTAEMTTTAEPINGANEQLTTTGEDEDMMMIE